MIYVHAIDFIVLQMSSKSLELPNQSIYIEVALGRRLVVRHCKFVNELIC